MEKNQNVTQIYSFIIYVKIKDTLVDIAKNVGRLDTSVYELDRPLPRRKYS